ncbi:MAG: HEAT repeat domain-containing protein [Acidobacteria bacterium]|nr:HEAT repeat domain-containing protein [Acidobacteriota bacterium]MBI3423386.1 HEAT repeat domain-containing protein [Acidobacteriota bacterium]
MLRQLTFVGLLLILFVGLSTAQTTATRTYTRADFVNVDGSSLNDKLDRAIQQFKAARQGDSCWVAYHPPVRANANYGMQNWTYSDGDGIRLERRDDPAGAAVFLLADLSTGKTVYTRVKTLNVNEPYQFENRPVYWLGNVDAGQSLAQLETLLRANQADTSEKSIVRSIVRAISYHDHPRVVGLLEEVAQKEQSFELQRSAIASLGSIGSKESLDALDKLFNNASPALKKEIVRAYRYAGDRANEKRVLDRLTALAKSNETADIRAEAVRRIASFRGDAVADRLFEIYDALGDQQLKREILQAVSIGDSVNERVIKRLITIAKSGSDAELQRAAVRRLGGERGDDQLDALIEIYDSVAVDGVREEVINRLARSNNRKASDKLLKIAKDEPNPRLRQAAIRRLSSRSS